MPAEEEAAEEPAEEETMEEYGEGPQDRSAQYAFRCDGPLRPGSRHAVLNWVSNMPPAENRMPKVAGLLPDVR